MFTLLLFIIVLPNESPADKARIFDRRGVAITDNALKARLDRSHYVKWK